LGFFLSLYVRPLGLPAQSKPPQPPAKAQETVIRTTTRLVQVSVIVQDGRNQPVADLKREDFVVLEDGKEQPISVFSVESLSALPQKQEAPPAGSYSNRLEQKPGVPTSVTVVLLDELNTRFEDNSYARQQIIKFLGQIEPQDRVALYVLSGRLRVLHDFTSDASRLVRALARHRGGEAAELGASEPEPADTGDEQLDAWLNARNELISNAYLQNRVRTTLSALEAIAHHLSRLPGRKNLVWVSSSFPIWFGMDSTRNSQAGNLSPQTGTFTQDIERTARSLTDANLAVYPVDARGLIGAFYGNWAASRSPKGPPLATTARIAPSHDSMIILADRTGGRAFYNSNDMAGAIRKAISDSRVTYTLGYYPSHNKWDGKFREIKVHVKREGVRVRHRRGYFALDYQPRDDKEKQAELAFAARSPLDATALGVTVEMERRDVAGMRLARLNLRLEPRDVTLERDADRWTGEVDIHILQRAGDGRQLESITHTLTMRLAQPRYEELQREGILLDKQLELKAQTEQLRVVARDARSGAIGSVTIPLAPVVQK
jgi:VWFA-related protein